MNIKRFDKHECQVVEVVLKAKLKELAEELGIDVRYAGGRFDANTFTMRVECSTVEESGFVNTRAAEDFKRSAQFYGLEATDLGRRFNYSFETYEITGLKPKSRKFPIIAKRVKDGREFKFMVTSVRDALDKKYKDAPEDAGNNFSLHNLANKP